MTKHRESPDLPAIVAPAARRASSGRASRRQFLKGAALAGAALAAPTFVPASALGRNGTVAPSERILLGGIGIGTRGAFDLNWMLAETDVRFVAVCDVRRERRQAVKQLVDRRYGNQDCATFHDMRDMLASRTAL